MDSEKLKKYHLRMLSKIEADAFETRKRTGRPDFSDLVMTATAAVPRHKFMASEEARFA